MREKLCVRGDLVGTGSQGCLLLCQPHGCEAAAVPCPRLQAVEMLSTHSWWLYVYTHTPNPSSYTGRCRDKVLPSPAPTCMHMAFRWTWRPQVAQSCSSSPANQDWSLLVQYSTHDIWVTATVGLRSSVSPGADPSAPALLLLLAPAPRSPWGSWLTPAAGTQTSCLHQLVWVKVC